MAGGVFNGGGGELIGPVGPGAGTAGGPEIGAVEFSGGGVSAGGATGPPATPGPAGRGSQTPPKPPAPVAGGLAGNQ